VLVLLGALLAAMLMLPLIGSKPPDLPTPTLGTDLPPGARTGTIETALGPARWVHLVGDSSTLPTEAPGTMPASWAASGNEAPFVGLYQPEGDGRVAFERWTSVDGLRWQMEVVDTPIAGDWAIPYDGAGASWVWVLSGELWRSTDGEQWRQIDMTTVLPDSPAAVRWELVINDLASTATETLVSVTARATEPFGTLEWPQFPAPGDVVEREPGLVVFRGSEVFARPDRLLRFEPTADGTRAIEEADGSVLVELPGVTLEDVTAWVRDGPPVAHRLAVVDGERLLPTFELDGIAPESQTSLGTMLGTPDGFLALVLDSFAGPMHLWRSEDGRSWTNLGPSAIAAEATGGELQMGASFGQFHVEEHVADGEMVAAIWHSADGFAWDKIAENVPTQNRPLELDSGFLVHQGVEAGSAWWTSADGSTWLPLDLGGLGLTIPDVGWSHGSVGDTVFITVGEGKQRELWALSFDTVAD
jgi:hypothetical protein